MADEFIMPKLGLTMEEGKIVEWLVAEGAEVAKGTPVLRIETDKVESDVEAPGAGRLHRSGEVGRTYACGVVIGFLLGDGETAPRSASTAPSSAKATSGASASATLDLPSEVVSGPLPDTGRQPVSPNARRVAKELGVDVTTVQGTGPGGRVVSEDVEAAAAAKPVAKPAAAPVVAPVTAAATRPADSDVPASVAARQLADLLGVDLRAVGADADGRVSREGVARYVRQRLGSTVAPLPAGSTPAAPAAPAPTPAPAAPAKAPLAPPMQTPTEIKKFTGVRGTIAKRMHGALQDMAQLTLFMDADLDAVVADRTARKGQPAVPSFTDYVVAATARALRDHPIVNAQVVDAGIALLPEIHVGFAVAVPNGLMVPVVRNADRLGLADLATETSRLAEAGRNGKLKLPDLEGGTFSVSALGMFGVDGFTPVINPPNVAILGVGRLRDDVVLTDGKVSATKRLTLSLTWDHRVLDGAPAAQFTQSIVKYLADPAAMNTGAA
jgi:pyruvate dehydrogenase E2 component (dihydrolipoamide acetyltransferase)